MFTIISAIYFISSLIGLVCFCLKLCQSNSTNPFKLAMEISLDAACLEDKSSKETAQSFDEQDV